MPIRIQRRRERGWRLPAGAVIVTRQTKWGNPYRVGDYAQPITSDDSGVRLVGKRFRIRNAAHAVELYRTIIRGREAEIRAELAGKDLACWCPVGPDTHCHADVLLSIAAGESI